MGIEKDKREATDAAELRRRAEEELKTKMAQAPHSRTEAESQRHLHELQVHQIELEMQNAELLRARDAVETALEMYTDLYDFAPVGYFTLDCSESVRSVNLTGASLLGVERARLIGRRFDSFLLPDARATFIPFLEKVFASQVKEACEVELTKVGNRPLHAHIEAIAAASSEECRIAVIDITARREAEEELRRSESRYSTLFNNKYVVKLLIDPETGEILKANPAACSFYGYSSEQFASMRICDINTLPQHDILEKMGQALKMEGSLFHFRHRLANGELRDVEVYSGPIEIEGRRLLYSIVHDVSERKRIEDKLRKSENQLAEAQMLAHIGSWEWDSIADEITGSDEFNRMFGLILSSYESFMEVVHPNDRETVNKAVQETLDIQAPYDVHYRIIRPDGITRVIHAQGVAIADGSGKTVRMIGTCQDDTERREIEARLEMLHSELADHAVELEAANREFESANIELEAFNYMVAHDLRNPLNTISGYSQVIQQTCGDKLNEECKGYVQEIYETTHRMDRLIGALLKFSSTLRAELRHDPVDLSGMAWEVSASLESMEPERKVTYRIADGVNVNGDANLLRIVLDNLIGNAWKYSGNREGTVIEFGVTEKEGQQVCFVRDNGPGFDMAKADKLFLPFQRIHESNVKGHGIGLATVERIIRRHGGRVWAEGEPGKGATFYFTLATD
jgi:PAS domain S-box-containing protein